MFLRSYAQFVLERVMPDLLHIIPVAHDAVLDRVLEGRDPSLNLRLVADVKVLLPFLQDVLITRATDDGWENGSWAVIARETGLVYAGSIVQNQSSNVVFDH